MLNKNIGSTLRALTSLKDEIKRARAENETTILKVDSDDGSARVRMSAAFDIKSIEIDDEAIPEADRIRICAKIRDTLNVALKTARVGAEETMRKKFNVIFPGLF